MIGTGEDLGPAYKYQQMEIPADYFISDYHLFREIMGSREYNLEYKEDAFAALSYVYLNISEDDPKLERCIVIFVALSEEFARRKAMMLFDPEIH